MAGEFNSLPEFGKCVVTAAVVNKLPSNMVSRDDPLFQALLDETTVTLPNIFNGPRTVSTASSGDRSIAVITYPEPTQRCIDAFKLGALTPPQLIEAAQKKLGVHK